MGRPLLTYSIDGIVTYPSVYLVTPYIHIHPNCITFLCMVFKVLSLVEIWNLSHFNAWRFGFYLTVERFTDCLDGEVARYHNKCSPVGHYLDKCSDIVFRYSGIVIMFRSAWPFLTTGSWMAFYILALSCSLCGVYIYEGCITKKIKSDMITPRDSYAIYIEDNIATMLCVALPYMYSCMLS